METRRAADAVRPRRLDRRKPRDRLVGDHHGAGNRRLAARRDADAARRRRFQVATAIPGGLAWRADRAVVHLDLFHPLCCGSSRGRRQHLRVADAPDIAYSAGGFTCWYRCDSTLGAAVDLQAEALRASIPSPRR